MVAGYEGKVRTGLHLCRGNWSKREEVLISGDYQPLVSCLQSINIDQFVLEFATPRAGDLKIVGEHLAHKEIGLGSVNPRTDKAEDPRDIANRVVEAMEYWNAEKIFLNPDCGFGCFAHRCVNDEQTASNKLKSMVLAAKKLRNL